MIFTRKTHRPAHLRSAAFMLGSVLLIPLPALAASRASSPQSTWAAEEEAAVQQARRGNSEWALMKLEKLHLRYPHELRITRDLIAVSDWTGHSQRVIALYKKLPAGGQPDYVLQAVGHAYRDLQNPGDALTVYRKLLAQSPGSEVASVGVIRSLIDLGQYAEAQQTAEDDLQKHGARLQVLLAAAEAADKNKRIYEELAYAERAHELAPDNAEAVRALIRAEDRVGAPQLSLMLIAQHPGILSAKEQRQIEGDATANAVRWGNLEPLTEETRYAETDRAIAQLDAQIARWSALGEDASPEVMRARFDRLIALSNRLRMQDVVNEYQQLKAQGATLPPYVLGPVGDAYLYLRQPEQARDLFLQALERDPRNFEIRRQLFFAYVECNDFKNAYATVDALDAEQPLWLYKKGQPERLENPNRAAADRDVGNARLYGDELAAADRQISAVTQAAPFDVRNRAALGNLYLGRGWPRAAAEQFDIGTQIAGGKELGNETGRASAALDMRDYTGAEVRTQDLMRRFPENTGVQRADRLWQVHNKAELNTSAYYTFRSSGNAQGGAGYGANATVYSAPIEYNWRIFAGQGFKHEDEPNLEGKIDYWRSLIGVEYRDVDVVASIAPTYNAYTPTGQGSEKSVGLNAAADWALGDQWSTGLGFELFTDDVPLRALNSGVDADKYSANVQWRQSESREVRLNAEAMSFSDDNLRTSAGLAYSERIYTDPYWKVDGLAALGTSHNSEDQNRTYFNPALDVAARAGARVTQTLYRRYQTLYEHSLTLSPGLYWQQDYGNSPSLNARYEQIFRTNDVLDAGFLIDYGRQDYDGDGQNNLSIFLNATGRF